MSYESKSRSSELRIQSPELSSESAPSLQLTVPIRDVQKIPPGRMEFTRSEVSYRMPARLLRVLDQSDRGLVGSPVALADVAGQARADDIFPGGRTAARER